jgi:hypothetical protein
MKYKYLTIIILAIICNSGISKYRNLQKPASQTELDHLAKILSPVAKFVKPQSLIGFQTNADKGRQGVLYFKSALILAPAVLKNAESDTVLLLQDRKFPLQRINSKTCIVQGDSENFAYALIVHER